MIKKTITTTLLLALTTAALAQDINELVKKVQAKLQTVNDYEASGTMKTNVSFLKVPQSNVKIYFKKPNKLKIKSEKGISFVPKGAVSINLNNLVAGNNYTVIDAGADKVEGKPVRVVKLLPTDDNADVVLSILYIDAANAVIKKAKTTTRENGTYELLMTYGKYINNGLPDKVLFTFNTKDYKLPKGVTFDFDDGKNQPKAPAEANKKGSAEISFTSYTINKGVSDTVFQ
jgi:outer membrane lipoprotein-sorting protein